MRAAFAKKLQSAAAHANQRPTQTPLGLKWLSPTNC